MGKRVLASSGEGWEGWATWLPTKASGGIGLIGAVSRETKEEESLARPVSLVVISLSMSLESDMGCQQ